MPDRILDERERGFEAQFAHDEDVRFRTLARRDKLFAVWAAERMHLDDAARLELGHDVLKIEGWPAHDDALLRYVSGKLEWYGVGLPREEIARALSACEARAHEQVMAAPLS